MANVAGYDSLFPLTVFGRLVTCAGIISGVMTLAVTVSTVSNNFVMDLAESKAYLLINKLVSNEDCKKIAITSIQSWTRLMSHRRSQAKEADPAAYKRLIFGFNYNVMRLRAAHKYHTV